MSFTTATNPADLPQGALRAAFIERCLLNQQIAGNPRHTGQLAFTTPSTRDMALPAPLDAAAMTPIVRPIAGVLESAGGGGSVRPETPGLLWPRGS